MTASKLVLRTILLVCCAVLSASSVHAQFTASIQGTVLDPQGTAVPNAKVTVTNQDTGVTRDTITSPEGFYRVNELAPGNYTVTVQAAGFTTSVSKNISVEAEKPRGFDINLQVGEITQEVTVTASNEGLQTEDASISTTISQQQVERLPQFGRDPYELIHLAPGVFGDGSRSAGGQSVGFPNGPGATRGAAGGPGGSNISIFQTENQQPISSNGQRITSNDYTIDGVSVNSLNWGGAAVVTPTQESVQEITVISNDYAAEDGRNTGAHVKVITKGGTNQFHGSGFFQYETPGLNAFNKFNGFNPGVGFAPTVRVDNNFRNFGGSAGGPVVKDKLFFFFAYEGLRSNQATFDNQYVDTAQFDQTFASFFPNTATATILGQSGIRPRIAQVLPTTCALWPANQCQVVNGGINIGTPTGAYGQYVSLGDPTGGGLGTLPDLEFAQITTPSTFSNNQYNARVDYVRGRNTFAASTYLTQFNSLAADDGSASRPMDDFNSKRFTPTGFLSWTTTLSTTMANEARFNFTRFAFNEVTGNPNVNFGIPRIEIQGLPLPAGQRIKFGTNQSSTQPGVFAQNTYAFRDAFSQQKGVHAFKYGVEYAHEQNNSDPLGGGRPDYVFQFPWNFINGTPIFEQIAVDPRTGAPTGDTRHFRTSAWGAFIQDDWKFRPNLTFNIGLRYDYFGPLSDASHQLAVLRLGTGASALQNAKITNPDQMTNPNYKDFGPRLGLAWSPSKFNNNLVVRLGAGIAYDRIEDVAYINSGQNPPFFANYGICCGTSSTDFSTPFDGGKILYALGANKSPLSYPANPVLGGGTDPATGLPTPSNGGATIYGAPQNMNTPYVYLYSTDVQYAGLKNWLFTAGYSGSETRHELRIKNLSYFYNVTGTQQQELGTALFFFTPDVTGNYNALNTRAERRFSNGMQFIFDYRYSKSMDELSNSGPGFTTNQTFPTDQKTEYGPSDYDATHAVRAFGLWDLPLYRTNQNWQGKLLGGWQINGVFQFHSGFPWTPVSFSNCFTLGVNFLCPVRPISYNGKAGHDLSTDAFLPAGPSGGSVNFPGGAVKGKFFDVTSVPNQIPFPGVGRNSFRGPRFSSFDFAIGKNFGLPNAPVLGENAKLNFRANFFNAFNKLNLSPFTFGSPSTDVNNPQFATATDGLAGRIVEFQLRLTF